MNRVRNLFGLLAVLVLAGWLAADDTKKAEEPKDTPAKTKGTLPPGWKKLGLTDAQIQDIYKVHTKYRTKIDELEQQVRELRQQERTEEYKLLTDAQKARLKELGEEKFTGDVAKKDDPKKDDPKKDDTKKDDTKKDDTKKP
jgi:Spy/CpxP family protein refolding chaperone